MTEIKLTPEQQKLFDANFNRRAYEQAKSPIQKAICESQCFAEVLDRLHGYEYDVEYEDDFTIISCEVELDRSHMETEGDYVGVCFDIKWFDESDSGTISRVALFSSEPSKEYIADLLCYIDPNTCEVTEWVYEDPEKPDIDDKQ